MMSTGIEGDCGQILSLELSPLDYSDTTDAFNGDDDENDYDTNDTIDMEERYNNNPITDSNAPLLRPIIALALPSAIQSILSNAYGFNSFVFVGHMRNRELSSIATTALSSIVGVNIVIFAFHNIIPSGANTHTSQYVGAENPGMVGLCFRSAFYSSIALSSIVGLLGFIFIDHISAVCNSDDPRVREAIGEYLGIVFLTSPFFSFMLLVDGYFKSIGDVATPFYLECLSLVLNTIMNYLLVVHFDYGIGGSAIATSIARLLPALFGLYKILFQTNRGIMVSLSMLQNLPQERPADEMMEMTTNEEKYRNDVEDENVFDDNITTERHQPTLWSNLLFILDNSIGMARIGVFDSLAAFIYGMCFTSLVRICGLIGVAQQAGLGAGLRGIEWLGFCLSEGFLVAAATAVGQCVGANAHERAMDVAIVCCSLSALAAGAFGLPFVFYSVDISQLLSNDEDIVKYCAEYVYVCGWVMSLIGFEMACYGCLLGSGKANIACSVNGALNILRIPLALYCLFSSQPVMEIARMTLWAFGLLEMEQFPQLTGDFYCIAGVIAFTASVKAFIWFSYFSYLRISGRYFKGSSVVIDGDRVGKDYRELLGADEE